MIIGIDARALSIKKPAGIATYLRGILKQLQDIDKENEYILYSNVEIDASVVRADNFRIKIVKGAVGSFWLRFKMPKGDQKRRRHGVLGSRARSSETQKRHNLCADGL